MSKNSSYFSFIENLREGEILVAEIPNDQERKELHNYLDERYPELGHKSVECKKLNRRIQRTIKTCPECEDPRYEDKEPCKTKVILEYREGSMKNNQDEYYSGVCPKCGEIATWECNYDDLDEVIRISYPGKYFVIGKSISGSDFKTKADFPNINEILNKTKFTRILISSDLLNNFEKMSQGQLGNFIFDLLNGK